MPVKLQKGNLTIPLGGKLVENIDPKLLTKGAMAKSENVLFDKHGAVTKAPGCAIVTPTPPRANVSLLYGHAMESIGEGGREMLMAGGFLQDTSGYSYLGEGYQAVAVDETTDILRPLGSWPPIKQSNKTAVYSAAGAKDPCIAILGGYIWHVWIGTDRPGARPPYLTVIEADTGAIVLERHNLTLSGSKQQPHIVVVGTKLMVYTVDVGTRNLHRNILDPADPANPGAETTSYAALNFATQLLDVCSLVDPVHGDVACSVFKDAAGNLRAISQDYNTGLRRNEILASIATYDPIGAVACARIQDYTVGALGPFMGYVYQDTSAANDDITYGMISEDLQTPYFSNVSVLTMAGQVLKQVTIAEEPADAWETGFANSSIRIWMGTEDFATSTPRVRSLRAKFAIPGGIYQAEDKSWWHHRLQTKAYYHRGRSHCWLRYSADATGPDQPSGVLAAYREGRAGFESVKLHLTEAYNFHVSLVAREDQGLPDVVLTGSNRLHWTTLRQEFAGAKTIQYSIVDYAAEGLRPAPTDRNYLFGGGYVQCYDGQLQDHGFFHDPSLLSNTPAGAGGLTALGVYQWLAIYEWTDRNGEWHASGPMVPFEYTLGAGETLTTLAFCPLCAGEWYRNDYQVKIVVYRTLAGGSEFHYEGEVLNDPDVVSVSFVSTATDVVIESNRLPYTDGRPGSALDNTCPPPMTQIVQHHDRLLGISHEDPRDVWFTKPASVGVAPEFSVFQKKRFPVPLDGLASIGDYWIGFSNDQIYAVAGSGPDVFGVAGEFLQPRLISDGIGLANPRSLAETDLGVIFQSARGFERLPANLRPEYISAPVEDEITSWGIARCLADSENSRLHFMGVDPSGLQLVYDYKHDRWTTITPRGINPVDACVHGGVINTLHLLGAFRTQTTYKIDGVTDVTMALETPWLHVGNLTGFQRIWWVNILGEYKAPHTLRVKQYVDYIDATAIGQIDFDAASASVASPYNFRWKPARQKCAVVKFVISELDQLTPFTSADWVALELTIGYKGPLPKRAKNLGG